MRNWCYEYPGFSNQITRFKALQTYLVAKYIKSRQLMTIVERVYGWSTLVIFTLLACDAPMEAAGTQGLPFIRIVWWTVFNVFDQWKIYTSEERSSMGSIPPCEHFEHYNCWPGVDHYTISSLDYGCIWPTHFCVFNEALEPLAMDQSSHP